MKIIEQSQSYKFRLHVSFEFCSENEIFKNSHPAVSSRHDYRPAQNTHARFGEIRSTRFCRRAEMGNTEKSLRTSSTTFLGGEKQREQ